MQQKYELAMVQGNICPDPGFRNLTFSFESNVLGKSQKTFRLEINPASKKTPIFNFNFTGSLNEGLQKSRGKNFTQPFI